MSKIVKVGKLPNWVYRSVVSSRSEELINNANEFINLDCSGAYIVQENNTLYLKIPYDKDNVSAITNFIHYIFTGLRYPYTGYRTQHGTYKWYEGMDDTFVFEIKSTLGECDITDVIYVTFVNFERTIVKDENKIVMEFEIKNIEKDPRDGTSRTIKDVIDLSL